MMYPRRGTGRITNFVEPQAMFFTASAWACWWDLIDTAHNQIGWGLDIWFYGYCRRRVRDFRMGIVDSMSAAHRSQLSSRKWQSSGDPLQQIEGQRRWWAANRVALPDVPSEAT